MHTTSAKNQIKFHADLPSHERIATLVLGASLALWTTHHLPPSRADEPAGARSAHDDLHARYAEARLTLAELDLEKATLLEKHGSGRIVPDQEWRRLRGRVAVLREIVETHRERPHGTGIDGQRARARAAVKIADEDLAQARAIHEHGETPFTELAVRRFETKAEIARLRLAIWDDPANVPSIIDEMQMQIDQLTDHVVDLLDEIDSDRIND
jgi:hypothetical protein